MITPVYNRTSSNIRMTATDMNRICANVNEICGGSLKTNWTSSDIVDAGTWYSICDRVASLGRYTITYSSDYINVNYIEKSLYEQYNETHHIGEPARLTSLAISNGTLSPAFDDGTYTYTATVSEATSTVTATSDYSAIAYTLGGETIDPASVEWEYGTNTLAVTATLNGVTKTYTVTVTCTFQKASLNSLTIGGDSITVNQFMSYQTDNASDSISYTATGTATVYLNGEEVTGGTLAWRFGSNTVTITVVADDTKTYTVAADCTYQAPIPALIAGINISSSFLEPRFSEQSYTYNVYPTSTTSTIDVIPDGEIEFTLTFNGTAIVDGSEVEWNEEGGDVITVVTTATEGYTSVTYTVTSQAELVTEQLAPMRSGEIYAGDALPGEGYE